MEEWQDTANTRKSGSGGSTGARIEAGADDFGVVWLRPQPAYELLSVAMAFTAAQLNPTGCSDLPRQRTTKTGNADKSEDKGLYMFLLLI
jgi:hypothetical protein